MGEVVADRGERDREIVALEDRAAAGRRGEIGEAVLEVEARGALGVRSGDPERLHGRAIHPGGETQRLQGIDRDSGGVRPAGHLPEVTGGVVAHR